jgi:trimeric autotransporter adhesin
MKNRNTLLTTLLLTLACFGLASTVPAVVPAPDGGYAGNNTSEGTAALFSLTSGIDNTALGFKALYHNSTGSHNSAEGFGALFGNTGGNYNTASGDSALLTNTSGRYNTADGYSALYRNNTGISNTAIGVGALLNNTSGSSNTALGINAGTGVTTASGVICIGVGGANVPNSCFIGNIYGKMAGFGTAVYVNSGGQLGTTNSSRRFKDDVKPMDKASEALLTLKPVTFHYKKEVDPDRTPQFGLVAEEVEKVNRDLVIRDADGKPYTVRYEAVNAMLLNEFLKEHRKVEELKSTIAKQEAIVAKQQKQMEAFAAQLKEQASQIQKVSAQVEMGKAAPQIVAGNQ